MKRILSVIFVVLLLCAVVFSGCSAVDEGPALVGVLLPTQSLQRWNQDGENIEKTLEERGYKVELYYADNDVAQQLDQLLALMDNGAKIIVIAAVDGSALSVPLKDVDHSDVAIIAYDRMLMDTDAVDYHISFDSEQIGRMQGQYILDALGLSGGGHGPYNLELFAGSPDDNNSRLLNKGAMEVLSPYIESGDLVVKSGMGTIHEDWMKIGIMEWKTLGAQSKMDTLLTNYYKNDVVDAVLSPNDSLAKGIITALEKHGYGAEDMPYPALTGQDCDLDNIRLLIDGKQSMSVFKDTRVLAEAVADMADSLIAGSDMPFTCYSTNNYKDVPTYLIDAVFVDGQNYEELLVESGYYSMDQIKGK